MESHTHGEWAHTCSPGKGGAWPFSPCRVAAGRLAGGNEQRAQDRLPGWAAAHSLLKDAQTPNRPAGKHGDHAAMGTLGWYTLQVGFYMNNPELAPWLYCFGCSNY